LPLRSGCSRWRCRLAPSSGRRRRDGSRNGHDPHRWHCGANGSATRAINELAKEIGNIRVLPIAGHGALANVRDLLRLKGVDFAVLNSDIFPFLEQTRQYPNAQKQIRYATHIYSQKVYLLTRKEFKTIADLRKRKIAVPRADRAVTQRR
jgi:TRAP-type uncharacterized transport system substrate-binding protein